MANTRIIAFSNQKGGVGKTTSAVNVAASLAAAEYRVLLVDFDPQGNASSALGIEARDLKPSSYEMLIQEAEPKDCVVKTELSYLDLIPANQELIGAEIELVSALGREHRLKDALNTLKVNYDYILIDCPPALGLLTVNALVAAHGVIVPLQCEYFALEGLSQLMKTVELVKKFPVNFQMDLNRFLRSGECLFCWSESPGFGTCWNNSCLFRYHFRSHV